MDNRCRQTKQVVNCQTSFRSSEMMRLDSAISQRMQYKRDSLRILNQECGPRVKEYYIAFLIWRPYKKDAQMLEHRVDSRSTPINVLPTGKPLSGVTDVQGGLRAVIADAKQSRLVTEVDKKGVAPKSSIPNQAPSSTIKMLQFLYRLYQHYNRTTAVSV